MTRGRLYRVVALRNSEGLAQLHSARAPLFVYVFIYIYICIRAAQTREEEDGCQEKKRARAPFTRWAYNDKWSPPAPYPSPSTLTIRSGAVIFFRRFFLPSTLSRTVDDYRGRGNRESCYSMRIYIVRARVCACVCLHARTCVRQYGISVCFSTRKKKRPAVRRRIKLQLCNRRRLKIHLYIVYTTTVTHEVPTATICICIQIPLGVIRVEKI